MKRLLVGLLGVSLMMGCSSQSSKPAEKPQPKPPEFVTGRTAFQKIFVAARGWNRDAQPYRLESQTTADSDGKDGKSGVWNGWFGSPSTHSGKRYTWSGSGAPDAPDRGVSFGSDDSFNPSNSSTHVFDIAFLKKDSDEALAVAQKHGGDKVLAKDANTHVFYALDWSSASNELVWHVIYGPSKDQIRLNVAVNASSGEFIRVDK
jgi:hypothetical protein